MAISQLESPKFKAVYAAGASSGTPGEALASGRIFVTTTGGTYTTAADRATVYDDKAKTTEATRDADGAIALDAAGEVELWFDGVVDIRVESTTEELQYTLTGIQSSPVAVVTGNFNLVQNGSFEIDTGLDGSPDNWTLTTETSGTIAIDSSSGGQVHGTNGLKFTGAGSGGGIALSDAFDVPTSSNINLKWFFKQSGAATGTYSVDVLYFKSDGSASTVDVEEEAWSSTSGAPTSWTEYKSTVSVPSDATQAKIRLTGLENGGTDETGDCWFDNVIIWEAGTPNLYLLDAPANLISTAVGSGAWTQVDMSAEYAAAFNDHAKWAIISANWFSDDGAAGPFVDTQIAVYAQENGLGGATDNQNTVIRTKANVAAGDSIRANCGYYVVKLDSNSDFEYQYTAAGAASNIALSIELVGYYT